jgi:hypothetical protein
LFTSHSCYSSFGRETSLVNIMVSRSIFPPLLLPQFLLLLFPFSCIHYYYFPLVFDPLQTARPERLTTSLYSLGAKLFVVCAGPGQGSNFCLKMVPLFPCHLLEEFRVLRETNLGIFAKGNLLLATSQPSTWGNQRGGVIYTIKQVFWRRCRGLHSSR